MRHALYCHYFDDLRLLGWVTFDTSHHGITTEDFNP